MITVALSFSARAPIFGALAKKANWAIANWASVICTCMLQQEETDIPGQTRGARYIATVHATEESKLRSQRRQMAPQSQIKYKQSNVRKGMCCPVIEDLNVVETFAPFTWDRRISENN